MRMVGNQGTFSRLSFVLAASQVDLRIPNPFLKYTQTKPSEWPREIVQQVVGSSMLQALGDIPQSSTVPHAKDDSTPFNVSAMQRHLRRVEAYRDNPRSLTEYKHNICSRVPLLISRMLIWLKASKEMRYDVERFDKTVLVNNREQYIVDSVAGCSVCGVPIFHYTHATFRFECRRPEFEARAPGLLEHHEQNDEILDAMDLATLIALAQGQREMGVEVPVYTVYVLYLSETYKDLNVVTAAIPVTTFAAIENGEHSIHKIKVDRGMIPIDIDYEKPLWDNVLVKMLDSFLDHGVELAKLLPQPPYDYEQD